MAVAGEVQLLERLAQRGHLDRLAGAHRQGVLLPEVAQLDLALQHDVAGGHALAAHRLRRFVRKLGEQRLETIGVEVVEQREHRARHIVHHVGTEHAPGREPGRIGGHDDLGDPHLLGQQRSDQRAGAAEGDQRELPRVVAALDGDLPHGADGAGEEDVEHAGGGLDD